MDPAAPELSPPPAPVAAEPLAVELEGTLLAGGLTGEILVRLARRRPLALLLAPAWLARGRSHFARAAGGHVRLDPAGLAYRQDTLDLIRREREAGRSCVLVTKHFPEPARAIAEHLGLFDGVLAISPAGRDAPVPIPCRRVLLPGLKVLRPHQWVKNVLLFLPLLLAHKLNDGERWRAVWGAFLAFSLTASSVYVLNDLLDVEADRRHPRKRNRPFASGRLPLGWGPPLVVGLLGVAFTLAWVALPPLFTLLLALYLLVSTAYTFYLKTRLLVDVMVLAGLYTLRILAGGAAARVPVSKWLAAFSIFLFVSLAFAKRYTELLVVEEKGEPAASGRGYGVGDLRIIESVGPASGYMAVLVLAMYINDPAVALAGLYPTPAFLWMLCPLLLYWVTRLWFHAGRRALHDDPIVFAIRDRVSWYCLVTAGALVVLASAHGLRDYFPRAG